MGAEKGIARIAAVIGGRTSYDEAVLRGIRQHADSVKNSHLRLFFAGRGLPARLAEWQPHGILMQAAALTGPQIDAVIGLGKPTVSLSVVTSGRDIPLVGLDNTAVGRLAAGHLLERYLFNFAFVGVPGRHFAAVRYNAFTAALSEAGIECSTFTLSSWQPETIRRADKQAFMRWLNDQPRPLGIFAVHDAAAFAVAQLCEEHGIGIPEEIALISVDNDELLCELAFPPLSSIAVPARRVGYEAARILRRLMDGDRSAAHAALLLPPTGIITRRSTDIALHGDTAVDQALKFIQRQACRGIGVNDVLQHVHTCRRKLERRFAQAVGRSPLQEIIRVRMTFAKALLVETDLTVAEIAARTGYTTPSQLVAAFRKHEGLTPGVYRKKKGRVPRES